MILHSTDFASRQIGASSAMRIAFSIIALTACLGVGKALLAHGLAASAATTSVAEPAPQIVAAKDTCRQVTVETDEGYGVRGEVSRWICRKAL
jgi:hypothetical protein